MEPLDEPVKNKTLQEEFYETWSWYEILRELANGDLTRMDEMASLDLYTVLNDMAYNRHKIQLQNYLIKKQNGK